MAEGTALHSLSVEISVHVDFAAVYMFGTVAVFAVLVTLAARA